MSGRYGPYGWIPTCEGCGGDMYPCCRACMFPQFTPLSGMRMLARGLLAHQGYDPDLHPGLVAEIEDTIGEELLAIGREALARHGMPALGPLEVGA